MKIIKAPYIGYMNKNYKEQSDDVDFKEINCDWIVYSYLSGSYEGSGNAISHKNNQFYHHDIGHCSCYGPEDNIEFKNGFLSIEDLMNNSSEELKNELSPIIRLIKDKNLCKS